MCHVVSDYGRRRWSWPPPSLGRCARHVPAVVLLQATSSASRSSTSRASASRRSWAPQREWCSTAAAPSSSGSCRWRSAGSPSSSARSSFSWSGSSSSSGESPSTTSCRQARRGAGCGGLAALGARGSWRGWPREDQVGGTWRGRLVILFYIIQFFFIIISSSIKHIKIYYIS